MTRILKLCVMTDEVSLFLFFLQENSRQKSSFCPMDPLRTWVSAQHQNLELLSLPQLELFLLIQVRKVGVQTSNRIVARWGANDKFFATVLCVMSFRRKNELKKNKKTRRQLKWSWVLVINNIKSKQRKRGQCERGMCENYWATKRCLLSLSNSLF